MFLHASLSMLEKDAKPTAGNCLEHPQSRLARVFRSGNFGCGQFSINMRLSGRMSCAQRALLFWFGSAAWASNGQYASQRELFGFHCNIIQHRQLDLSSILLFGFQLPQNGNPSGTGGALASTSKGCQVCRAATRCVNSQMRGFQSAPRAPSLVGIDALKCNEAAW